MLLSQGLELVLSDLPPCTKAAVSQWGQRVPGWERAATDKTSELEPWLFIPVTMWIFSLSTQG